MVARTNQTGVKKPLEQILTKEQQNKAKEAASYIKKGNIPTFERSGNQKYVFKDSDKNPYVSMFSVDPSVKVTIFTDGQKTSQRYTDSGGNVGEMFSIKDYQYIIFVQENQDKVLQTVITADQKVKLYMQQILGLPLG